MSPHQQNTNPQSNSKLLDQNNNNIKKPLKILSEEFQLVANRFFNNLFNNVKYDNIS